MGDGGVGFGGLQVRSGGDDRNDEDEEPENADLVEVADAHERADVGKESAADRPEIPFLTAIAFDGLSSAAETAESNTNQSKEEDESHEAAGLALGNKLVAEVPHIRAPGAVFLCADEPPIAKAGDEIVDEHGAVIAGRAADDADASDEEPNGRLHDDAESGDGRNDRPAGKAHIAAKRKIAKGSERSDIGEEGRAGG